MHSEAEKILAADPAAAAAAVAAARAGGEPQDGQKTCVSAEKSEQAQGNPNRAWNEGFEFALRACGWQEGEDPTTEGLYVVRDSKGNVEVGMWYEKTFNGQPAQWSKEFRDVDRDDIVAWIMVPPYGRADG